MFTQKIRMVKDLNKVMTSFQINLGEISISLALSNGSLFGQKDSPLLGDVHVNATSLLNLLETRLGVNSPDVSFTTRLVKYLHCVEKTDNSNA